MLRHFMMSGFYLNRENVSIRLTSPHIFLSGVHLTGFTFFKYILIVTKIYSPPSFLIGYYNLLNRFVLKFTEKFFIFGIKMYYSV